MKKFHPFLLGPAAWCVLAVAAMAGCGGGTAPQVETGDPAEVKDLVYDMSDNSRSRDLFEEMFIEGQVPDEATRKKYNRAAFSLAEDPQLEGDRAVMKVEVLDLDSDSLDGTIVEWIAVKDGDEWKLESAPLE